MSAKPPRILQIEESELGALALLYRRPLRVADLPNLEVEIAFTRVAPDGTPEAQFGNGLQPGNEYVVEMRLASPWRAATEVLTGQQIVDMARELAKRMEEAE
jgi:hypothetical protein